MIDETSKYAGKELGDFLLHSTEVNDLVFITSYGWPADVCEIDDEDLFYQYKDTDLMHSEIVVAKKETVEVIHEDGKKVRRTIWYIDVND